MNENNRKTNLWRSNSYIWAKSYLVVSGITFFNTINMCDRGRTVTHMQIPRFHTQVWYNRLDYYFSAMVQLWSEVPYLHDCCADLHPQTPEEIETSLIPDETKAPEAYLITFEYPETESVSAYLEILDVITICPGGEDCSKATYHKWDIGHVITVCHPESGLLYINRYCAVCHGIEAEDTTALVLLLSKCRDKPSMGMDDISEWLEKNSTLLFNL